MSEREAMIGVEACQALDRTEGRQRFSLAETTAAPSVSMSAPDTLPLKRPRDYGAAVI